MLQDLPDVVSNVQTSEKIEVMSYNFLTKQPIVGSFYLVPPLLPRPPLHSILLETWLRLPVIFLFSVSIFSLRNSGS